MKRLMLSGIALMLSFGISQAQNSKSLPYQAKHVVDKFYPNEEIKEVEIDRNEENETYQVKLTNGTEIDFDNKGEVSQIDANKEVPAGLVPSDIRKYIMKKYPDKKITEWELDENGQEIELSDGTEVEFTKDGKFKEEDKFLGIDW